MRLEDSIDRIPHKENFVANDVSLFGKFATPGVEWDEDELETYLHEIGTEWEQEMDELTDDDSPNNIDI